MTTEAQANTQVIVIHGGTTYANYDDFLRDLATKTVHLDRLTYKPMWKERLQQNLGNQYQVLLPAMPNKTNAKYNEWKLWFDRIAEVAADGCILVGHSLGGIFLAKYLSENTFPKKIAATLLVAAPYNDEQNEDLTDFKLSTVTPLFKKQAGEVTFYFGADDPVIPISERNHYQKDLPDAMFVTLPAPDHFVRPDFPEIVDRILSVPHA